MALTLLVVGQTLLVMLGPLSRVMDPDAESAGLGGLALLAPDSIAYLGWSDSWTAVMAQPWTRWGYLAVLRVGHLLGDAALFVVTLQTLAFWAAGWGLLRPGRRVAGPVAGLAAASALLLNPSTAQWMRFVLTEAFFYTLVV